MKKRLFAILLALTLALTLLPGMTPAAADDGQSLGTLGQTCPECKTEQVLEIIGYVWKRDGFQVNEKQHWLLVLCPSCHEKGLLAGDDHCGGTETPTCTTGKTCAKCGGEYGILGHNWDVWQSNNDNKTHTRTCKRDGCDAAETKNCGGDGTATCVTQGTCTVCGQQYYGGHTFPTRWKWESDTEVGRDAEYHWLRCLNCKEGEAYENTHSFVPGNMYLKSAATCISKDVYYTNCSTCYYKGTDTYVNEWDKTNPKNHDGGTEVKNAKDATCTEKGYTGDTYCKGCNAKLYDGTDIPATGHDLKHTAAKRATTRAEGNIEYWYCSGCDKYYKDAEATKEITQKDTVIRKRRPSGDSTTDDKTVKSVKTGDAGIALYVGMAALSLTGGAWLRRKTK